MLLRDFLSPAKYRGCETHITAKKSALTVACRRYLLRVTNVDKVAPPEKKTNTVCRNFLGFFFFEEYFL